MADTNGTVILFGDKRSQVSISGGSTLCGAKLDFFDPVCSVCMDAGDKRSQVSIPGGSTLRGAKLDFFDPVCSVCYKLQLIKPTTVNTAAEAAG